MFGLEWGKLKLERAPWWDLRLRKNELMFDETIGRAN